jgi:release factor glutamine methyltransferase
LTGWEALRASTTRAEALAGLGAIFRDCGFDEPLREARLTLCAAAGLTLAALIAGPDEPLGPRRRQVEDFARRRADGEPLSKILGRRAFWGLDLRVSRDVLDPRPETETIVEAALALFGGRKREPLRILDLGVGSGALLCALLSEFRRARGIGVDRSQAAAQIARENVEFCGIRGRAEIRVCSWTEGLEGPFDLIVSNPPYIPRGDIASLPREVRDFDPLLALDGGADGLDAYRAILPAAARLVAPGGAVMVEIGAGQAPDVLGIAKSAGLAEAATRRDIAGIERVVIGRRAA